MSNNFNSQIDDDIDKSDDEFDECMTLGKSSAFEAVKWTFPDTDTCPLVGCGLSFSSRLFAIVHFRSNHSASAMACTICEVPFESADTCNLVQHYEIHHPEADLPTMKMDLEIDEFSAENYYEGSYEGTAWNDDDIINDGLIGEDWIDLMGCGKNSRWKFPNCMTKCPECDAEFENRDDIIAHYKETHADDTILCYLCDWPILGTNFQMHFRLLHPNDVNPFHFDDGPQSEISLPPQVEESLLEVEESSPQAEESQSENEKSESETEENATSEIFDELVELRGLNIKTLWRFPDTTNCPVRKCPHRIANSFANRMEAKCHYVKVHARNSILCTRCDKPIVAPLKLYYENHFKRKHPNAKVPFDLGKTRQETSDEDDTDDDDEDDDDDADGNNLIKLKGGGIISYWQLPANLNRCPVVGCRMVHENNADLKQHYKRKHAKNAVLCEPCGYPLMVRCPKYFQDHLRKTHPNMLHSYDFARMNRKWRKQKTASSANDDDNSYNMVEMSACNIKTFWMFPKHITKCPERFCQEEFVDNAATLQHYRLEHAKYAYYCDLCVKPITASDLTNLKKHFNAKHPDTKPVDIFGVPSTSMPSPLSVKIMQQKKSQQGDGQVDDLIALGKKCNQKNYWRFPLRTTRCPSHGCSLDFSTRAGAIHHYRECHADSYILCSFCAKPVYAPSTKKMRAHFKTMHPLHSFENDTSNGNQQALSEETKESTNDENSSHNGYEDEEDNGWMTLKGCGHITYWRFPSTTQCPAQRCSSTFRTRFECKNHYKVTHAQHSILCPTCNKPINVLKPKNFLRHHQLKHAGVKMPYAFMNDWGTEASAVNPLQQNVHKTNGYTAGTANYGDDINDEAKKKQALPSTENDAYDMIELYSCGIASRFQFPKFRKRCLNKRCNLSFESRPEAIRHYKREHGTAAIYCEECKKLVHAKYICQWQYHCDKWHPQVKTEVIVPPKSIDTTSTASKSPKSEHSSKSGTKIVCPLIGCSYKSRRIQKLRKHWDKLHSSFHFPAVHGKQFDDEQHDDPAVSCAAQTANVSETEMPEDAENSRAVENGNGETLLAPLSELLGPVDNSEPHHQSPPAKRQRLASTAADPYTFDEHEEDEVGEFRKHKSPKPSSDGEVCDGNVSSTAECSIDLGIIKMEIDSPLYDAEPPDTYQSPIWHPGFVLGEAHSLHPDDFIVNLDSDNESFHSAESLTEVDQLAKEKENDQTVTIENGPTAANDDNIPSEANEDEAKVDELTASNDEMEVTTTVQDCNQDNQ